MTQTNPADKIEATDNPELAKLHGLTEWDEARGQFVAPSGPVQHSNREGDGSETQTQSETAAPDAKREQPEADMKSAKRK